MHKEKETKKIVKEKETKKIVKFKNLANRKTLDILRKVC